jgi:hypothetical protein
LGYDTTLHIVPTHCAYAREVVDFMDGKCRLDIGEEFQDMAEKARDIALGELSEGDPGQAAIGLTYLWLMRASAEHPYVLGCGAALSLWDHAGSEESQIPEDLLGPTCLPLTEPFVARWPELAGQLDRQFEGDWEVGAYVSPERVPKLTEWIERRLASEPGNDTLREFASLLLPVLRAAARRGMGYWEATDLGMAGAPSDDPEMLPSVPGGAKK